MNEVDTLNLLDSINENKKPKLLLHACCGPCTLGVCYQVEKYFDVTILYYNPNIYPKEEYDKRFLYLKKINETYPFKLVEFGYDEDYFLNLVKGHEEDPEGGERCKICYEMRLRRIAEYAKENNFDFFTSTLSVSPYKDYEALNLIGNKLEAEIGIKYLYSNFKKHNGYIESIRLCKELGIYRQSYCGCRFSLKNE